MICQTLCRCCDDVLIPGNYKFMEWEDGELYPVCKECENETGKAEKSDREHYYLQS